jgi:hypothetical protein
MKAQFYLDAPFVVRIFSDETMVADLPVSIGNALYADEALKRVGFCRASKWLKTSWGFEASIRRNQG